MNENEKAFFEEIETDCKKVISKNINGFLKDKVFNTKDCDFMINYLNDKILKDLKGISENFKYILSLVLLENDTSGFSQNCSLYYDKETDGCISEKYAFDKIVCIVNLFCLSI